MTETNLHNESKDEKSQATVIVDKFIKEFINKYGKSPTTIYISDEEELQSYIMWVSMIYGLKVKLTLNYKTWVE